MKQGGRWGSAAKQAPHRPDSARAPGLRAAVVALPVYRRPHHPGRRIPMTARSWIRNLFAPTPRTVRTEGSRAAGRARCRPAVEVLEDRSLPAVTFSPAVNYATGITPESVAVGDFNGDGKQDLAVANQNSANVSVLLGKGDGTFNTAVNYDVV